MNMRKPTIASNILDNKLQKGMSFRFEQFHRVPMFIIKIVRKKDEKMFPFILIDSPLFKPLLPCLRKIGVLWYE